MKRRQRTKLFSLVTHLAESLYTVGFILRIHTILKTCFVMQHMAKCWYAVVLKSSSCGIYTSMMHISVRQIWYTVCENMTCVRPESSSTCVVTPKCQSQGHGGVFILMNASCLFLFKCKDDSLVCSNELAFFFRMYETKQVKKSPYLNCISHPKLSRAVAKLSFLKFDELWQKP